MDQLPRPPLPGEHREHRLLKAAIAESLANPSPSTPQNLVHDQMRAELARLDAKILAETGTSDPDEAEQFYLNKAIDEALNDPRPDIPNEIVCAEMQLMIQRLDQKIAQKIVAETKK